MGANKDVPKALAESLVIIAAADGRIHANEQKVLMESLKGIWIPGYGGMKPALGGAFREVKIAKDFGMDLKKKLKSHANLLSRVLTAREKKYFVDTMAKLAQADGEADRTELELYYIFKENVNQDPGFISSVQTTLTSFFKKKK
jgi:uncharacterized tellurite resistance protein B-like protein